MKNTNTKFNYKILDDGTAEITGYIGNATELEISSVIDGYIVTSIGYAAFENCKSLTGSSAFKNGGTDHAVSK